MLWSSNTYFCLDARHLRMFFRGFSIIVAALLSLWFDLNSGRKLSTMPKLVIRIMGFPFSPSLRLLGSAGITIRLSSLRLKKARPYTSATSEEHELTSKDAHRDQRERGLLLPLPLSVWGEPACGFCTWHRFLHP